MQVVVGIGLYLLGGPRASAPSGQLQSPLIHHSTTSTSDTLKGQTEQVPGPRRSEPYSMGWALAQLILQGGPSQSLLLIGLGVNPSH